MTGYRQKTLFSSKYNISKNQVSIQGKSELGFPPKQNVKPRSTNNQEGKNKQKEDKEHFCSALLIFFFTNQLPSIIGLKYPIR